MKNIPLSTVHSPLLYTVLSFHLPRLKSNADVTARMENEIVIAQNTPSGPQPKRFASKYASGISNNQNTKKFRYVGVHASPAPLNELSITIPSP